MSIASEIARLQGVKSDILQAIAAKGVTVPADSKLDDCPALIGQIGGGNVVTIGGRDYPYVQIGNQLWLAENLDYKFQVNGSQIPIGETGTPTTPAAWYNNNDEATYGIDGTYKCGLLYNWHALKYLEDNKATLLPDGWHVPTRTEWETLTTEVGGSNVAGTKLKATNGVIDGSWPSNWNGTDDYGFCALPAGYYYNTFQIGTSSCFWNITEDGKSFAYNSTIVAEHNSVTTSTYSKKRGHPVRLVKDSQ